MSRSSILLIVVGLLILGAAAYLFFGKTDTTSGVSADNSPASSAEIVFLNLTAQIDPVEFDTTILSDPRFNALRDIRTAIIPESSGRTDPFAPLSGVK